MEKVILIYTIPAEKAVLRVKVHRMLKKRSVEKIHDSVYALPANKENINFLEGVKKLLIKNNADAKILIGKIKENKD